MTSSEAAVAPGPEARVLARGHLHPGMLFLRFLDGLRASILPAVIALLSQEKWIGVLAVLVFVLSLVIAVVRYATFEYRLTTEELVTREGILHRQERRIPVNRIQDLSFEQSILRRLFGLVVVSVETASGQGAEARLDSLSRRAAERMREALYGARGRGAGAVRDPLQGELLLWQARGADLLLLGLTAQRVSAVLAAVLGGFEVLREVHLVDQATGVLRGLVQSVGALGLPVQGLLVVILVLLVLMAGVAISVLGAFLLFWGFVLTLREDVFVRRFGLFTRRAHALPRQKIQRVLVEQPLLRLLLDRAGVKADSAGGIAGDNERTKGGTDVIAPLLPLPDAGRLVGWLMPGFDLAASGWRGVSALLVVRVTILAALLALAATAVLAGPMGAWALFALALVPLGGLAGFLMWRRAGYALGGDHLALRYGMLGRTFAVVPLRKVQGVVLRAGPLDRMLRLARVVVYVAGGSPTTLAHLAREDADFLLGQIGREAGKTKFVW